MPCTTPPPPSPPPFPSDLQLYPTKDESTEAPLESATTGPAGSADPPSNDNSNTDTPLSERPTEEDDTILLSDSDDEESDNNDEDEGLGDPTGDNSP